MTVLDIVSIVGARPQFIKLAPVARALEVRGHRHHVIHTGQHYDDDMSAAFFRDLDIDTPVTNLNIGSGLHGEQTGAMLRDIERHLVNRRTDWVLVYGDTNSTIAGALAATKLGKSVAHLEAGLRSKNRSMPEELNRIATDHLSDLLLAPTVVAMQNLHTEGLSPRAILTGDVMADVCLTTLAKESLSEPPLDLGQGKIPYLVATIHRAENTDDGARLQRIVTELQYLQTPVVLAAHPRLLAKASQHGIELSGGALTVRQPFSYPEMVSVVASAVGVITDSGGLQKEAYILGTPCTTIRHETEWPETLQDGWNVLDGELEWLSQIAHRDAPPGDRDPAFGLGDAADRAIEALEERI